MQELDQAAADGLRVAVLGGAFWSVLCGALIIKIGGERRPWQILGALIIFGSLVGPFMVLGIGGVIDRELVEGNTALIVLAGVVLLVVGGLTRWTRTQAKGLVLLGTGTLILSALDLIDGEAASAAALLFVGVGELIVGGAILVGSATVRTLEYITGGLTIIGMTSLVIGSAELVEGRIIGVVPILSGAWVLSKRKTTVEIVVTQTDSESATL